MSAHEDAARRLLGRDWAEIEADAAAYIADTEARVVRRVWAANHPELWELRRPATGEEAPLKPLRAEPPAEQRRGVAEFGYDADGQIVLARRFHDHWAGRFDGTLAGVVWLERAWIRGVLLSLRHDRHGVDAHRVVLAGLYESSAGATRGRSAPRCSQPPTSPTNTTTRGWFASAGRRWTMPACPGSAAPRRRCAPPALPPSLGLGTFTERESFRSDRSMIWNPAEFRCFDPLPGELVGEPDLDDAYGLLAQDWELGENGREPQATLRRCAKQLVEAEWPVALTTTDDFCVFVVPDEQDGRPVWRRAVAGR